MELDYKQIGKRIKIARIQADMTQERLAELVELSPSHMSNIENGATKPSLTSLVDIANALAVTPDDLLCENAVHTRPQFDSDLQELLDRCDGCEIRIVRDVLAALLPALRNSISLRRLAVYFKEMNNL